ncbi:rubredoxin [Methanogenium organophilum]|uniref:Rubredoxin n=1 Tax=Methanogenium organophilum TaxID=2199 RepID=A0A9X9T955_METOG|nr:rubredoxin [Methanogenium organophilum]WAI02081.1 rubredoxin [Methanogenium organophilum]
MDATSRMKCTVCGHIYDPKKGDEGAAPGIAFADLPEDWRCPVCGAVKAKFTEVN